MHSSFHEPRSSAVSCTRSATRLGTFPARKAFATDLKRIYQAATEEVESELLRLSDIWGSRYTIAVRSWENNWQELATMFDYTAEIRRLIYTTNSVESYHSQLRRVIKTKSSFRTPEAARNCSTW
ncbi:MAG: transposase [Caldilineales bacterium]